MLIEGHGLVSVCCQYHAQEVFANVRSDACSVRHPKEPRDVSNQKTFFNLTRLWVAENSQTRSDESLSFVMISVTDKPLSHLNEERESYWYVEMLISTWTTYFPSSHL
jgi:hypothetical protein